MASKSTDATKRQTARSAAELKRANSGASNTEFIIDHEKIARRAYELWLGRGGAGGSPEDDWFRAERELRGETKVVHAAG